MSERITPSAARFALYWLMAHKEPAEDEKDTYEKSLKAIMKYYRLTREQAIYNIKSDAFIL